MKLILHSAVAYTIFTLYLISLGDFFRESNAQKEEQPEKIPIPDPIDPNNPHVHKKYCVNSNESHLIMGPCTDQVIPGGTKSPCPKHCFAEHTVNPGDPCDPMLYRFARRQYDDAQPKHKDWMGVEAGAPGIIGKPFQDVDADFQYKGECRFLCPRAMCMGVEVNSTINDTKKREQYVDIAKWDCVSDHLLDKYRGVCSCGYLWSFVDPQNAHHELNDKTLMVSYKMTVGLNRRLAWDSKKKTCAALRYGHCSLGWPNAIPAEMHTLCLNKPETKDGDKEQYKCVNRTANFLGVSYRPLQIKNSNIVPDAVLWYGICDSEVLIEDPFAGGENLHVSIWIILLISCFTIVLVNKMK